MRKISEQELKDILDKHGKWLRNEAGGERADLSSVDLSYADLHHVDLSFTNLSYANLSYANLSYATLRQADLSYTNLSYADLRCSDLSYANLSYANLSCATLRQADLRFANLIIFQFQQHQAFYTLDGTLRIGCLVMPITEWALGFKEIGAANSYTKEQIDMYGNFIKMCLEKFKRIKECE